MDRLAETVRGVFASSDKPVDKRLRVTSGNLARLHELANHGLCLLARHFPKLHTGVEKSLKC